MSVLTGSSSFYFSREDSVDEAIDFLPPPVNPSHTRQQQQPKCAYRIIRDFFLLFFSPFYLWREIFSRLPADERLSDTDDDIGSGRIGRKRASNGYFDGFLSINENLPSE